MSNSISKYTGSGEIANIIGSGAIILPFETTIYLQTVRVAGMNYYIEEDFTLLEGDKVILKREPNNKYDEYAIELFTSKGQKIGYVPKKSNKVFARLMDGGKILTAEVRITEYYFEELREVWVRIFLNDL